MYFAIDTTYTVYKTTHSVLCAPNTPEITWVLITQNQCRPVWAEPWQWYSSQNSQIMKKLAYEV